MMDSSSSDLPRGLAACPISTGRLELRLFMRAHYAVLSKAAGLRVIYQVVGDPRQCDQLYRAQRTAEKQRLDQKAAIRYRLAVEEAGGDEDHYVREQEEAVIERFGLMRFRRPLIVFVTCPVTGHQAVLPIDARIFDFPEDERALLDLLRTELAACKIERLAESGIFTAKSMRELQRHLDRVRRRVVKIVEDRVSKQSTKKRPSVRRRPKRNSPDPSLDTELRIWLLKDGGLGVETSRNGRLQGKSRFGARRGQPTCGRQLMMMLCQSQGRRVTVDDIANSIYGEEWRHAAGNPKESTRVLGCVRTLVDDTREKLQKAGIDERIIARVPRNTTRKDIVELHVRKLTGLGEMSTSDPAPVPNVFDGLDDSRVPTVDAEDSI